MKKKPTPQPEPVTYTAWKRRARALVTVPTTMGERHCMNFRCPRSWTTVPFSNWRDQFIAGRSPEQAASYATTYYTNTQARPKGRR